MPYMTAFAAETELLNTLQNKNNHTCLANATRDGETCSLEGLVFLLHDQPEI
jgi:hypothetical protein